MRSKFFALIAHFFRKTLRRVLSLSPFGSSVLKPNLKSEKKQAESQRNFSVFLQIRGNSNLYDVSQQKTNNLMVSTKKHLKRVRMTKLVSSISKSKSRSTVI